MKFITGRLFRYDIQECIPRYFQVFGKCQTPGGGSGGSGGHCTKNGDCPTTTIVTVQACDVNEVCKELENLGLFDFQIDKILRVNRPLLTRDGGGEDPTCTTDVTPKTPPPNCQRFENGVVRLQAETVEEVEEHVELSYGDTRPQYVKPVHCVGPVKKESLLKGLSSDYEYYAAGSVNFYSAFSYVTVNQGELASYLKGDASLEGESAFEQPGTVVGIGDIPLLNESIATSCCRTPLPLTLELKHGLNLIPPFARFLNQNKVFLPGLLNTPKTDFIKLNYSNREGLWIGNVHLVGDSPVVSGKERWDFNISFGCSTEGTWNFVLNIFMRRTGQKSITTFAASFPTSTVCKNDNFVKLSFNLNDGVTSPSSAVVLNDEAGFFRNLRMSFKVLPQDVQSLSQLDEDNTAAFKATLGDS